MVIEDTLFAIVAIVFGLCFGSFLNVLIVRIPLNKSVILPASACMSCGNKLCFYHNIPLFSYLFLRGKCGFCGTRISCMYPIIEAISGVIAFCVYVRFGFMIETIFIGMSLLLLLALSVIDFKTKEVPDSLNFAALVCAVIGGGLSGDFFTTLGSTFGLAGFFTLLRFALQNAFKKDVMGEGDIIVAATLAALVGWKLALFGVFLSAVFALVVLLAIRKKDYQIPYIPFLFLGILPCVFFTQVLNAFLDYIFYI